MSNTNKPLILVVDDIAQNLDVLATVLGTEYDVRMAKNGKAALAAARQLPTPQLILLDVMMPGRHDGLQVCASVRADPALADTRVVLLSARADGGDRAAGQAAGADEYLTKPFSPLQLLETIDRLLPTA